MTEIKRIGIDTSKAVFTLHCINQADQPVLRVNLRRAQMLPFFKKHLSAEVAMEACASSHHWARKLTVLGHNVRLIPPQYVRPFVKRAKNDRNDAEAICEAAGRPGMRFVLAKSAEQQAQGMVLKVRETLVGQRTQLINALRGHAAEFGVIAAKGISQVSAFKSGRHLAAWIGLTPKEHSTAGKQRMGGISRAGHERLRQLLVTGATAVIKLATRPGNRLATEWLLKLLQRRPRKLAAVALANKMARIAWAVMTSGEAYRHHAVADAVST
jgi:transposase